MRATEEPSTEPAAKAYSLPDGFGAEPGAKPVFTVALLAVLAGVFGLEQLGAVGGSGNGVLGPNAPSLVAMGGVFRGAIREQHEFYRLLSGPMMHGDLIHLALNGFSLFLVGAILERFVGRGWTMVLYAVGALGGSVASYAINPATLVSVGASGAIMGLLASALVVAFKLPEEQGRTQLQGMLLRFLVPSLIPLATSRSGAQIDFAAHFGGAIAGALAGLVMLALWDSEARAPRGLGVARVLGALCALVFLAGGVQAVRTYPRYAAELRTTDLLIPNAELPRTDEDGVSRAQALFARFPRDPRARLFMAARAQAQNEPAEAERHLRAALEEREIMRVQFTSGVLEVAIRARLADVLLGQQREADARAVLRPVCTSGPDGPVRRRITEMGFCGPGPLVLPSAASAP